MKQRTRRDFLTDVGKGMVIASVGPGLASDLGYSPAFANDGPERLTFGPREPLVALMQETPAARLLPEVITRLRQGAALRDVVAAVALANARTFGGEDYVGFHTMMAIAPAFHISEEMTDERRYLPVLKVLFRNASRIQEYGGPSREVLHPVQPAELPVDRPGQEVLREAVRRRSMDDAERTFARLAHDADTALNSALFAVQDGAEVHRVVLPYRSWDLMNIIGREQAHTLLRQSVRYCVRRESENFARRQDDIRTLLPRLLDQHRLEGRPAGTRQAEDSWVETMSQTILRGTPAQAADAVAAALAEGFEASALTEAISLAANQLVLRDNGRTQEADADKPIGSIHGDSIGVHACDSANAWRNLSRAANPRNKIVCLILSAWQVAFDRGDRGGDFLNWFPYPRTDARRAVENVGEAALLPALDEAIRAKDQARASALVQRYGSLDKPVAPVWDIFRRYAISEDGALHAEKFYRTASEEFTATRPAFRWRQLTALARVTASAHGRTAPGHADACRLLGV